MSRRYRPRFAGFAQAFLALPAVPALAVLVLAVQVLAAAGPAGAQTGVKADQVVAFVQKAIAHIDEVGEEQAFHDFSTNRNPWINGEFYIFCHTLDGVNVAHGGNPGLVGKKVLGFRDPTGAAVNQMILDKVTADGKGWVAYEWPNPVTNKVALKYVYAENVHDKFICGSGYYR